jgi:DNA-binding LytR/AlgR family response regulator
MHPILVSRARVAFYQLAWLPWAAAGAGLLAGPGKLPWLQSALTAAGLALFYALVCLSPWYSGRHLPFQPSAIGKLLLNHGAAALIAAALLLGLARLMSVPRSALLFLFGAGVLLYLLSVALHYVAFSAQASREAEARVGEAKLLAREAELKALKAQINPHFLFNSLNSISALATVDGARAREMCLRLSEFLRSTLNLAEQAEIPVEQELALARMYLDVERVRFGDRLRVGQSIDPDCGNCRVPSLILQPVVENAVKHGIAGLVDGGEICMAVQCRERTLHITVENDFDPDDEELARQVLREYVRSIPDLEVVAECANGFDAVKAITELKPDLVFLDVQMPKLDGFEVLELAGADFAVIFTTAYDSYAMRAFDAHAVDYLLKPFRLERFQTAVERARQRIGTPAAVPADLASAVRGPAHYAARIVVKEGTKVHVIPAERLDYAEAQDDYVSLHSEGKHFLKQQTIAGLEAMLDPEQFVRIHRSYLVNLARVDRIEPYAKDSRIAVLTGGARLPVSRTGYERLKALLERRG